VAFEIVLGVVGTVLILGMAGGSTLFAFVLYPRWHKKTKDARYPLVTKHGLRVAKIPVRGIKIEGIEKGVDMFITRAVEHGGYDRAALEAEFARSYLELVRAVNDDGKRYIIDRYGRKIAGDNDMENMRVVVLDDDKWQEVAGFHEFGHLAHETKGKVDYDHTDDIMWHEIVGWCKKEFAK
jgi:hypothetical protein